MSLKAKLQTPKGRLAAALSALLISWIFLFFYFVGPIGSVFPSEQMIEQAQDDLKKLQKENASLKEREKEMKALEKSYETLKDQSWKESDGLIETDFRNRIQSAAKAAALNLNSLGSVKLSKINNELYYAELDLQGSASIEVIAGFLSKVREIKPAVSWKRFDLRRTMGFMRMGGNNPSGADQISLNGTLRVICLGTQGGDQ